MDYQSAAMTGAHAKVFQRDICGQEGVGVVLQRKMGRGRDSGYPEPPAQIPACGTTAPGSYLEFWRQTAVPARGAGFGDEEASVSRSGSSVPR